MSRIDAGLCGDIVNTLPRRSAEIRRFAVGSHPRIESAPEALWIGDDNPLFHRLVLNVRDPRRPVRIAAASMQNKNQRRWLLGVQISRRMKKIPARMTAKVKISFREFNRRDVPPRGAGVVVCGRFGSSHPIDGCQPSQACACVGDDSKGLPPRKLRLTVVPLSALWHCIAPLVEGSLLHVFAGARAWDVF